MKGTLVTEENYNRICGRLIKFFKHHDFMVWHTFDSGFKKRNPMMCRFPPDHKKHSVVRLERAVAEIKEEGEIDSVGKLCIQYGWDLWDHDSYACGFILEPGMNVWFLGNRVTFKTEWNLVGEAKYLYQTFQIANPKQIAAMRDGGMYDDI